MQAAPNFTPQPDPLSSSSSNPNFDDVQTSLAAWLQCLGESTLLSPACKARKNECHNEFQMQSTSRSKTHTSNAVPTCIHTCTWIHTCMHTRIHGTLAVQQLPSQTKAAQNPTSVTLETPVCVLKKVENLAPPQEPTARQPH